MKKAKKALLKLDLMKVSQILMLALVFLAPLFFIPSTSLSLVFSKTLLISITTVVLAVLYIVYVMRKGLITVVWHPIMLAVLSIPLVYFISALFTDQVVFSLTGYGFETQTFGIILLLSIALFLVTVLISNIQLIIRVYGLIIIATLIVALYILARIFFGADFLSFDMFNVVASQFVGKWNDAGILFGLAVLLSIFSLEMLPLRRPVQIILYVTLVVGLVMMALINFFVAWLLLGIMSLIFFVYLFSLRRTETDKSKGISTVSLVVLLISIVFVVSGGVIGRQISEMAGINSIEVRPSWSSTLVVAKSSLSENLIVGSGPATFTQEWLKFKPSGVNLTNFWNNDFSSGISFVMTSIINTGLLGLLSWLFLFGTFGYLGVRSMFAKIDNELLKYVTTSSFLLTSFLWLVSIIYVPGVTILFLTFVFTGLTIVAFSYTNLLKIKKISFLSNQKTSFGSVLGFIALMVILIIIGFGFLQKGLSSYYFQKSSVTLSTSGDMQESERLLRKAISVNDADIYYRSLAELSIIRINSLVNEQGSNSTQQQFDAFFGTAIDSAEKAVEARPNNYLNRLALGNVFRSVVPNLAGAYEAAKTNYEQALLLNPHNPALFITMANLEVANSNLDQARLHIAGALKSKPNYTEALFLLSRLEATEGNVGNAIASVQQAVSIAPNDPSIHFQLGILEYSDQRYRSAISTFERAVGILPEYANARYFLGLSYEKVDRIADAITQFELLKQTNPNNTEVDSILANLRAGLDPFTTGGVTPEERESLPIEE